jgi:hypothetical protein
MCPISQSSHKDQSQAQPRFRTTDVAGGCGFTTRRVTVLRPSNIARTISVLNRIGFTAFSFQRFPAHRTKIDLPTTFARSERIRDYQLPIVDFSVEAISPYKVTGSTCAPVTAH